MESSANLSIPTSKLLGGSFLFSLFFLVEFMFVGFSIHSIKEGQFAGSIMALAFSCGIAIVGHGMFKRIFKFPGTNILALPDFYSKLPKISSVFLKSGIWGGAIILLADFTFGLFQLGFTSGSHNLVVTFLIVIAAFLIPIVLPIATISPIVIIVWCALMLIWSVILFCLFMPLLFNRDKIPKDSYSRYVKNFYCLIPAILLYIICVHVY